MSKISLGIIGGGQLGSLLCAAAKNININTVIISDDEDSPAKHFADHFIYSKYDNEENLAKFTSMVDKITYEFENIPYDVLSKLNKVKKVDPNPEVNKIVQHRYSEKNFLIKNNIKTTEFEKIINESDIKKETYCSSGPGGQSVNTTYSAVRLTHVPTGVVAQCQDQKSQIKNFAKALKVLRSRIYEIELNKRNEEIAGQRKTMVKTGDRSDKIRTYNYSQGRVTDHRIGLTLYSLNEIINGDIKIPIILLM